MSGRHADDVKVRKREKFKDIQLMPCELYTVFIIYRFGSATTYLIDWFSRVVGRVVTQRSGEQWHTSNFG